MLNSLAAIYGVGGVATDFESIQTVSLTGTQASISFTSIPSTYKHLQIRAISRDNRASVSSNNALMRFNGDTGNNYAWHQLLGDGASAIANASTSVSYLLANVEPSATATANIFGAFVIDILDYGSTNKNKTIRVLTGTDLNGSGSIRLFSGLWINSSTAISSIDIFPDSGSFVQYSQFALYGIKG